MDAHDAIVKLKDLAIELGRTPTRDEFAVGVRNGKNLPGKLFGSFATMCQAAGLEPHYVKEKKIDNSVFNRDLAKHLDEHVPISLPSTGDYESTLFIPDVHFPFEHQPTLDQIYEFAAEMKPKHIVQLGDLYDNYSHTRFPRSHNVFTPREETKLARDKAVQFWKTLQQASPGSKCYQITGNHSARPLKRILEVYPEAEDWIAKAIEDMMTFDGVVSITDPREELMMPGNVCVIHGYRSGLGQHRDFTMTNVVCGHTHRGGVVFRQVRGEIIWEMNAGLAGDPSAKGLSYTSQKISDWTLGWGWLDGYGPRFIPARRTK